MILGDAKTETGSGAAQKVIGVKFVEPRHDLTDAGKNHEAPARRKLPAKLDLRREHGVVAILPAFIAAQIVVHAELAEGVERCVPGGVAQESAGGNHRLVAEAVISIPAEDISLVGVVAVMESGAEIGVLAALRIELVVAGVPLRHEAGGVAVD